VCLQAWPIVRLGDGQYQFAPTRSDADDIFRILLYPGRPGHTLEHMKLKRLLIGIGSVIAIAAAGVVNAGTITIKDVEPGTIATVSFYDALNNPVSKGVTVPASGTVSITFTPQEQAGAHLVKKRYIPAGQAPAHVTKNTFFTVGVLPTLEPVDVVEFKTVTPTPADLEIDIQLEDLLAAGTTFNVGQLVTVTNGSITESPYITFPGYTGTVVVTPFDTITPVPTPASLTAGVVLCSVGLLRRRR
jgi:hypothetical protein